MMIGMLFSTSFDIVTFSSLFTHGASTQSLDQIIEKCVISARPRVIASTNESDGAICSSSSQKSIPLPQLPRNISHQLLLDRPMTEEYSVCRSVTRGLAPFVLGSVSNEMGGEPR